MEDKKELRYTLALLVKDHAGVLQRVVGLFSRRCYNIVSLSVGPTSTEGISRITIVVGGNESIVRQIKNQLEKLIDVHRVVILDSERSVQSELLLVKLQTKDGNRSQVLELGEVFKAKIVDVTLETITFQMIGGLNKVHSFLDLAKPFGIVEMARTGMTALERGPLPLSLHPYDEDDD
ncbi:MAG: acetolactate synthase small subunit [Spirochaetia bacterium]|jgi:acetolactate synthase-1/3 small subunit|nr:acetolactate synthase small subunit [Spirochaetia bacterium]